MFILIKRIFQTAWQGLVRNRWLTLACVVMMVISLLLFSTIFVFNYISHSLIDYLKNKVDISLYFKPDIPEEDILKIKDQLLTQEEIEDIDYISKEEALKRFQNIAESNPIVKKALGEIGENPLVASLNIKARDTKDYQKIVDYINHSPFKTKLITIDLAENKRVIERIDALARGIRWGSLLTVIVLGFLSIVISFNTIRMAIYSLREEIEIMKLVGASNGFIRAPFLVEGMIEGVVASVIALILLIPLVFWLGPKVEVFLTAVDLKQFLWDNLLRIFLYQVLFAITLGVISSLWAINKYLRV